MEKSIGKYYGNNKTYSVQVVREGIISLANRLDDKEIDLDFIKRSLIKYAKCISDVDLREREDI